MSVTQPGGGKKKSIQNYTYSMFAHQTQLPVLDVASWPELAGSVFESSVSACFADEILQQVMVHF